MTGSAPEPIDKRTPVCYTEHMLVTQAIRYRLRPTAGRETYFLRLADNCIYERLIARSLPTYHR